LEIATLFRYGNGLTQTEIAAKLGITRRAVQYTIDKGLKVTPQHNQAGVKPLLQ
jgi:DNA-binding transcriptional regulator LsrR (DeoR family)